MKKYLLVFMLGAVASSAFAEVRSYNAGPIWNDGDAQGKCSAVCSSHNGSWNGQWRTVVQGQTSTCDCVKHRYDGGGYGHHHRHDGQWGPRYRRCQIRPISAGPIWSNMDANVKCPNICANINGRWTGEWRTIRPGQSSVCKCRRCDVE